MRPANRLLAIGRRRRRDRRQLDVRGGPPTFGGQVSIPASDRVRVEVGTHVLPWMLEDGDDLGVVTQVQVRIPFRHGQPGAAAACSSGRTAISTGNRWESAGDEWHFHTFLRPHAGVSWQWQKGRHLDVRIDLQGVITAPSIALRRAVRGVLGGLARRTGWS